jgi:hypothetical protein
MAAGAFSSTKGSLVKIPPMEFEKTLIIRKIKVANPVA